MTETERDQIGMLVDECDNLLAAATLPLPPETHLEGLRGGLENIRDQLAEICDYDNLV